CCGGSRPGSSELRGARPIPSRANPAQPPPELVVSVTHGITWPGNDPWSDWLTRPLLFAPRARPQPGAVPPSLPPAPAKDVSILLPRPGGEVMTGSWSQT